MRIKEAGDVNLAIYGAGGLGQEICDMADLHFAGRWDQVFFINDLIEGETDTEGHVTMPYNMFRERYTPEQTVFVIATGEPYYRKVFFERIRIDGYKVTTLIHPEAEISRSAVIGEGVIIGRGCVVNHHVHLRENTCMMVYCVIGHDTEIMDHCQLSSFVSTGGHCRIGSCTFVGQNAVIREHTQIGGFSIVGECANVIRDVSDEEVVAGNPAKVIYRNAKKRVFDR